MLTVRQPATDVLKGKSLEVLWKVLLRVLLELGFSVKCSRGAQANWGCSREQILLTPQEEHSGALPGAPPISLAVSTLGSTFWRTPISHSTLRSTFKSTPDLPV